MHLKMRWIYAKTKVRARVTRAWMTFRQAAATVGDTRIRVSSELRAWTCNQ